MMLVDTSVWIELLNGKVGSKLTEADLLDIVTCGPILQEVLQGLRDDPASEALRESLLALPVLSNPVPIALFLSAAEIYRLGRARTVFRSGTRIATSRPSRGIRASGQGA
jgi:predicted nucleic acid-binding protein